MKSLSVNGLKDKDESKSAHFWIAITCFQQFLLSKSSAAGHNMSSAGKQSQVELEESANSLNPLPDDKISDWSKLKQTADDILKYI